MAQSWKPRQGKPIVELFAWVCTEPDGGEGVIAALGENGIMAPCVGADRERIESYRADAKIIHQMTGYPVRLVKFSTREIMEELP